MIAYRRISDAPYRIAYETAPLGEVANVEHKIPGSGSMRPETMSGKNWCAILRR